MLAYQVQGWGSGPNTAMGGKSLLSSRATLDSSQAGVARRLYFVQPWSDWCTLWVSPKHLLCQRSFPKDMFPHTVSFSVKRVNYPPLLQEYPLVWVNEKIPSHCPRNWLRTHQGLKCTQWGWRDVCQRFQENGFLSFRLSSHLKHLMMQELKLSSYLLQP